MIPTPHQLPHQRRRLSAPNARNDRVETWEPSAPILAHAVAGPDAALTDPARYGYRIDYVVYTPREVEVAVGDRITVRNTVCAVVKVLDWTAGPWVFPEAGHEIHLQTVEG